MEANKKRTWILFVALLAGSLLLRLIQINQGMSYDEMWTVVVFILLPWKKIVTYFPQPNNHILNTLLAKLSLTIFGDHEWSLRLPSLVMGTLTPPTLYLLMKKRFNHSASFSAGLIMALNYWAVWFSQDARGYAGFILFSMLNQFLYLDWTDNRKNKTIFFYLISAVAACYFHLYMIFILAGQIGYGFLLWLKLKAFKPKTSLVQEPQPSKAIRKKKRKQEKKEKPESNQAGRREIIMFILPVTAVLLSLLLYIPLFGQMARYYNSAGHLVAGKWLDLKFLGDLVKIFSGSHYPAAGIIICLAGLPGLHRLYKSQNRLFWLYGLPIFFIILSTLTLHLFIYARFLAFAMPLFAMALACSLDFLSEPASLKIKRININIFPAAGLILISVLLAFSLSRYYRLEKQGFKKAGLYIQEKYPGVPVISYGAASVLFKLYIPPAEGFSRKQSLEPEDLTGKLVVGSFPASWSEHSRQILTRYCRLEEVWPGAGEEDDTVYLYNCLGKGSRGGSE